MADEVRIRLRKQTPSEGDENGAAATLEQVRVGDRQALALVMPDRIISRFGLVLGDRFVVESPDESPMTVEFKYALDTIAAHLETTRENLMALPPVGLLNTREGERHYWRVKSGTPELPIARCKYGFVVQAGKTHFVYLHPAVWDSGRDIVPTSIHLLLHVFRPDGTEEEVRGIEREICGILDLEPEGILEQSA